ncbi:hypothetical protein D2E25_1910 [Bifidobacterium goeldii]|uniref:DUF8094 domain-containing protein n=2 Tax=Bifidobacterium goeldii TaxID=2306975 RepID=A0A430FE78_9BIFI|nr:hypothetical protein [Bifidobacterium goeldii]RSX51062.1 hypothetical protein D2E25_1910 [Bifidobacterium goeldii]
MNGNRMNNRVTRLIAAVLACGLTVALAGCEGQVPQAVAPTTKDSEIPNVTVAQEKKIRKTVLDLLDQASAAKSADGIGSRLSGPELAVRTSQLNIAHATGGEIDGHATIPDKVAQVIIPTDNEWPRVIFSITTTTDDQQSKRLLVFRQDSARQNYKLWGLTRLFEGVSLPKFAVAHLGSEMGDVNDSNLVMTPKQAVERYADVLQNGSQSKYASSFADDQLRQTLATQSQNVQQGVAGNNGSQQQTFAPVDGQIAVMRSSDGGDLVVAQIDSEWIRSAGDGRESLPASNDEKALFGNATATSTIKATYVNVVAIYVPLKDSGEQAAAVAAERQVIQVIPQ